MMLGVVAHESSSQLIQASKDRWNVACDTKNHLIARGKMRPSHRERLLEILKLTVGDSGTDCTSCGALDDLRNGRAAEVMGVLEDGFQSIEFPVGKTA